jgi:hypothetical protein
LAQRLEGLQSIAASFNRYLGSVRAATTGIETAHGAGDRGAAELNDYVDQVEDVEQQLFERRQWMSNIIHDFSIAGGEAFLILGVLLPLLSVVLTIAWLWHRDIIRFRL